MSINKMEKTLKHYTECLDKKIIGDCIIERNYNAAIAEIKEMYKTSHFTNMLENTKDIETHKYTEEQYNADLKKWLEDVKQNEKYTKGQTNWTEKYAHFFKKWSNKISEDKIYISSQTLEILVRNELNKKIVITSATPINTENIDITEIIDNLKNEFIYTTQ